MCGLDISFEKSILYKRIVTKFFLDYCLNSQVCNYGERAVIGVTPQKYPRFFFIILLYIPGIN